MFLLSVHAVIQKSGQTWKESGGLAVIRRNDVSLGDASRAWVSRLGWEKLLWHTDVIAILGTCLSLL